MSKAMPRKGTTISTRDEEEWEEGQPHMYLCQHNNCSLSLTQQDVKDVMGARHSKSKHKNTSGSRGTRKRYGEGPSLRHSSDESHPTTIRVQPAISDELETLSLSNNNNNEDIPIKGHIGETIWDHKLVNVIKFKASMEKKLTTTDETTPGVLKYKTPLFR